MRKIVSLIVGVAALLVIAVAPASAHFSWYTGHGTNYGGYTTVFGRNWDGCDWTWETDTGDLWACGHWHSYGHTNPWLSTHTCWMWLEGADPFRHEGGRPHNYWYNPSPTCWANKY